jgi:hypothetical protein
MNPTDRIAELLRACGTPDSILPPTALFNEGWMLRVVLDWASRHPAAIDALRFDEGSRWFSEALLGSRFSPRSRGDRSGEGFTHADAVIGHFRLRPGGRGDIELLPGARQFTVVEAKMASGLSPGTKYAPAFNQAARNVACIAHLLCTTPAESVSNCGFVVLAPAARIEASVFRAMDKLAIASAVAARAKEFAPEAVAWCETVFRPALARCQVHLVSWEAVLDKIGSVEPRAGEGLQHFYSRCLQFNPLPPEKPTISYSVAKQSAV